MNIFNATIQDYLFILSDENNITLIRENEFNKIPFRVHLSCNGTTKRYNITSSDKELWIPNIRSNNCHIKISANKLPHRVLLRDYKKALDLQNSYPRILIIGSGRSGTTSLAHFFNGLTFENGKIVISKHETLWNHMLLKIINNSTDDIIRYYKGFHHDIESAPYLTSYAGHLPAEKIIHIIRDGRSVVQSGYNRGWYDRISLWDDMKPDFVGTRFEKCCKFWLYQVNNAEKHAHITVRLEDLVTVKSELDALVKFTGIQKTSRPFPVSNKGNRPSTFDSWDTQQKDIFNSICGEAMDEFYPEWKR
jgi:hypothetical protein